MVDQPFRDGYALLSRRAERGRIRAAALEEAALYVERFRMPRDGEGPLLLLDVISRIAHELRGMK